MCYMCNATYRELNALSKIVSYCLGDKTAMPSHTEKELAYKYLENLCDRKTDWSPEQKELYKLLIQIGKNME